MTPAVLWLPAAAGATPADPGSSFLQYGALGALALILLGVTRYLYKGQADAWRQRAELAEARADRAEQALAALNATVQERTMRALDEATRAVAEALSRRRDR